MERPNILVIDSDPKNLQILRDSLESANFSVTTTGNGTEAWDIVRSKRPDIIVSEVDIPGINGFDLLDRLQKDPVGSAVPLVFLTNRRNLEDRIKSLRTGVKDYMIKPLHVKEVIARLQMILRRLDRFKGEEYDTPRKIVGRLEENSVEHLVENYGVERRTGVLALYDRNDRNGEIYFKNGSVINARLGNFRAEKAVYQMLPWDEGHFIMTLKEVDINNEITVSNLGLLLQGFKRYQEREQLAKQLPPADTVMLKTELFEKILKRKAVTGDALRFISLFDGTRTLSQIVSESTYDDLKTLERTLRLYQQGFIEPVGGHPDLKPLPSLMAEPKPESPPAQTAVNEEQEKPAIELGLREPPLAPEEDIRISYASEETQETAEGVPGNGKSFPDAAETGHDDDLAASESLTESQHESEETLAVSESEKSSLAGQTLEPPFATAPNVPEQVHEAQQPEALRPDTAPADDGLPKVTEDRRIDTRFAIDQPTSEDIGNICDGLLNGQTDAAAYLAIIGGSNDFRRELVGKLTSGNSATKQLSNKQDDQLEFGKILTPKKRTVEILSASTESKLLQMLHQIASSLIGYVVLVPSDDSVSLGYFGYLINSLKGKFIKPHVVAVYTPAGSKRIPLDFVRYSLKLSENEQIVDLNIADPNSLTYLLKQLEAPMYLKEDVPEPNPTQKQSA